jgi:hypothetical protein
MRAASNVTPFRSTKRKPAAKPSAEVQSFTGWKLDILDAMASDPRVRAGTFRIAFRVMQAVNAETRVGFISDLTLCDDVPKTDRFKCRHARTELEGLGWWEVERGHGGRASRYIFSPANINIILDKCILEKEERDRIRLERKSRDRRFKKDGVK